MQKEIRFQIVIEGSSRGGKSLSVKTEPMAFPYVIAQVGERLPNIVTMQPDIDMMQVTIGVLRNEKGTIQTSTVIPEKVQIEPRSLRWLEELAYNGFVEVEKFEHQLEVFEMDDEVSRIAQLIMQHPELANSLDSIEPAKPCPNCGGFHEDPSEMMEEVEHQMPAALRNLLAPLGEFVKIMGMGKPKANSSTVKGLTFRIYDEELVRSHFKDEVFPRLKPRIIAAVKESLAKAIEANNAMLEMHVTDLVAAETGFDDEVEQQRKALEQEIEKRKKHLAKVRGQIGQEISQMQVLTAALTTAGIENLPEVKALPELSPAKIEEVAADTSKGNGADTQAPAETVQVQPETGTSDGAQADA